MAEIRLRNIAKRFGDYQALHSIDLTIADQEFMVLLGASGCGKTTLLRIIAGLESPSEGEVWIGDRRVDDLPPRERGISMVFQNYAIFPHLTVFDNIAFGLKMHRLSEKTIRERVHRTATMMHIEQLLDRYSGQVSGGQRQRVAVARALAMEPDVILMDEPLSNLDALLRLEMRAELKGVLAQSATTAIYVTHDQIEAMSLADRISVMHQGKIVQSDSPVHLYRYPADRFVAGFIGNPPMNILPADSMGGGRWQIANREFKGPQAKAETIEFAIRPEDLHLAEEGIEGRVQVVEPLGPHLLLTCDVAGCTFRATVDNDHAVNPGDIRYFAPQPDRIRWFDPITDLALA